MISLTYADLCRLARGYNSCAGDRVYPLFVQLYDEEEEGIADLPMIGTTEPTVVEDLEMTMEDIFEDLHSEGQINMDSPEATQGEGRTWGNHGRGSTRGQRPRRGGTC